MLDSEEMRERADAASGIVLDSAMAVHSFLGPGLLERTYVACLAEELLYRGMPVQMQVDVPVIYRARRLDFGYRIDLLVDGALVVEVKAVATLLAVHQAQLLSYLRLSGHRIGLLLNFHEPHLRDGIRRVVNDHAWRGPQVGSRNARTG